MKQPPTTATSSSSLPKFGGPALNVTWQWVSVMFLALQPRELITSIPDEILRGIQPAELQFGAGIRESLPEGFSLRDFPMKGSPFEQYESQLKRNFFQYMKTLPTADRAGPFLRGELFDEEFHRHGAQYRAHSGQLQFEVKNFIDSLMQDTIWVKCELAKAGTIHPNELVKGETHFSFLVWAE
ncbi:hypothetical protein E8E12_011100 [Didymella heteroderae]|uniref:Uncharacterized protein n=1 Tax=Didymella heteroderae TaxID=1769908 RepID=A0A9P5C5N5_9PLEO|nr:hypothetical protein E8E12_011100 [Didymella heteroderae]